MIIQTWGFCTDPAWTSGKGRRSRFVLFERLARAHVKSCDQEVFYDLLGDLLGCVIGRVEP